MTTHLKLCAMPALLCLVLAGCSSASNGGKGHAPSPATSSSSLTAEDAVPSVSRPSETDMASPSADSSLSGDPGALGSSAYDEAKRLAHGAAIPAFDGPFASVYTEAYRVSTSDQQRAALADGNIDTTELQRLYGDLQACMRRQGFEDFTIDAQWGESRSMREDISDAEQEQIDFDCRRTHLGAVELLGDMEHPFHRHAYSGQDDIAETPVEHIAAMGECFVQIGYLRDLTSPESRAEDFIITPAEGEVEHPLRTPLEECLAQYRNSTNTSSTGTR